MGGFKYTAIYARRVPPLLAKVINFLAVIINGLYIYYSQGYDAIVTYGAYATAIEGIIVKLFTGTKLIVRIPGVPGKDYLFDSDRHTPLTCTP